MNYYLTNDVTIYVQGQDSTPWLQGLITSNIDDVVPNTSHYTLFLDAKGPILADARVSKRENQYCITTHKTLASTLCNHFEQYLVMEDVTYHLSKDRIIHVWPTMIPDIHCQTSQTYRLQTKGWDVTAAVEKLEDTLTTLQNNHYQPIDEEQWEALRIDDGIPNILMDMENNTLPQEMGLSNALNFHKGCYLGQEAVTKLEHRGKMRKRLMKMEITSPTKPGEKILDQHSHAIGTVTSTQGCTALGLIKNQGIQAKHMFIGRKEIKQAIVVEYPPHRDNETDRI